MTPSVNQSSGCCLRLRSNRPIPSFPCSSSISRSCELLLFIMIGPILRLNIPSLYIGCTLDVSLVRRITDLSWRADNKLVWEAGIVPYAEGKKKKSITSRMGSEVDFSLKCKNPHAAAGVKMLCSFSVRHI